MDQFTVGDRCLVHRLESEAGLLLNGLHVTLADAIIEKGRFKCRFDDGSFANIKPCNLQIINGDRVNQTKEKCEENASSNLNKKEDQIEKKVTTDDADKKETESPPPTTHQQQEEEEGEECSICLDLLPKHESPVKGMPNKFQRATCCGKGMHNKCRADMIASKMSLEQKRRCVMCRTKYPDDTKKGNKESVKRLRKWVKKGKAWAQLMLGERYRNGEGVKKDLKRAVVLFKLASDQGHAGAQYNLGIMYADAVGVDKDETRAVEFFTLAADQGFVDAQHNLGVMYADGQGVDKDEKRALKWYTLASDKGLADAQYNLGLMYANGQGVGFSPRKAREWITKAASQGFEDAINALYYYYCLVLVLVLVSFAIFYVFYRQFHHHLLFEL